MLISTGYSGGSALTLYFSGCDFRCGYCQNVKMVKGEIVSRTTKKELLSFLKKQRNRLDSIWLTGGEPTLTKDILSLVRAIKALGYQIKLDTNGSNLKALKVIAPYIDLISIDLKATPDDYDRITNHQGSWVKVRETLSWVVKSGISHEIRSTVIPEYHDWANLKIMSNIVGRSLWYLQQYEEPDEGVLDEKHHERYTDKELENLAKALKAEVSELASKDNRRYLNEIVAP